MKPISFRNITFIALASAGALCSVTSCSRSSGSTHSTETVPDIEVAEAAVDSIILHKVYPGTLTAANTVDIVARVNGYLKSVNFSGGDLVRKGQILFTIEDATYRDACTQAEAQLASARSNLDFSTKQYAAMKKALESDAVSQMEVFQAKNSMEAAEASVHQAEANLNNARTQLSYCVVRAPMEGHITSNSFDPGSFLAGEGSPVKLATIYNDAALTANFYIEDASYLRMFSNENGRSQINFSAIPVSFRETLPHTYTGNLNYMSPSVDTSTGTLLLQARVENPYGELRTGMYTEISLPWKIEPKAVLVQDAALSSDQLGSYLYVVNDSDKVVYTPVKTGELVADTMRVITSGLKGGERYVTKAMLKVRDGMKVNPVGM